MIATLYEGLFQHLLVEPVNSSSSRSPTSLASQVKRGVARSRRATTIFTPGGSKRKERKPTLRFPLLARAPAEGTDMHRKFRHEFASIIIIIIIMMLHELKAEDH